ncbi:MAG: murein biosynthesis integral membrane protein MurJ [Planctomycetes bacterium]|nr:murein biosynthesis integral membrane protein MurJ [Planctomycetota bacterium]
MPPPEKDPLAAIRPARAIALATLASRVLGLLRDKATVYWFPQATADAILLAWTIPNLFRRLFGEGALSSALVPVLAETEAREGREGRNRVARSVIWSLIATLAPLTAALVAALLLLPQRWLLLFFESDTTGAETLRLLRFTLPYLLFICVAGQLQAVANLAGRFFFPALAPALSNLTWIAGAAVAGALADGGPADATWVAIGILAGGVLQVACQWIELYRCGERCLAPAPLRTSEVRDVSRRMAPMVLGLAAGQINTLLGSFFAEWLVPGEGAVTQLYLGQRLMQLPLGVVGVAIGTAIYPALARAAARQDEGELGATLATALRTTATLCIPAILGLMTLAAPIMVLLFEGGKLDAAAAAASGACMAAYAPTLFLQTAVLLLARVDYARGEQRRPVRISLQAVGVNLVLNALLVVPLGAVGLALGTTLATLFNAVALARGLRLATLDVRRELLAPGLRVVAATAVMALVVVAWRLLFAERGAAIVTVGGIALGLLAFAGAARLLARAELAELVALLRSRRQRGREPPRTMPPE